MLAAADTAMEDFEGEVLAQVAKVRRKSAQHRRSAPTGVCFVSACLSFRF